MPQALIALGLAIGWMDILGAILFQLMVICILCRHYRSTRSEAAALEYAAAPMLYRGNFPRDCNHVWLFWGYLLLLNVWIVVTVLMLMGITQHKPDLLLFWLVWCLGGLIFDVFFVIWWFVELLTGDSIEALTNIMISFVTMVIEVGFMYAIYKIYNNLLEESAAQKRQSRHYY